MEVAEDQTEKMRLTGDLAQRRAADLSAALAQISRVAGEPRGGGFGRDWSLFARTCLTRWGTDMERTIERAAEALAEAHAAPLTDNGVDAIERAMWRIVGARDKLRAIVSLALGIPALQRAGPGVRFKPDYRKIDRRLRELGAGGNADALRLKTLFKQIADHPAVSLRNQISHSLAPIPEAAELCWIDVALLDDQNSIRGWDTTKRLFPENVLDLDSIAPEALYEFALSAGEEALQLVGEAAETVAALIRVEGAFHQPYAIYRDVKGKLHLDRPPGLGPWSKLTRSR
jgi:hypothetical protein